MAILHDIPIRLFSTSTSDHYQVGSWSNKGHLTGPTTIYSSHTSKYSSSNQSSTSNSIVCPEAIQESPRGGFELRQKQAIRVLKNSSDLQEVRDVISHFPFIDSHTPERVLVGRSDYTLYKSFCSSGIEKASGSATQKAARLAQIFRGSKSDEQRQIYMSQAIMYNGNLKTFLADLDLEIWYSFSHTPFADLIRQSVGVDMPSVRKMVKKFSSIQKFSIQQLESDVCIKEELGKLELDNQNKALLSIYSLSGYGTDLPTNPTDILSDLLTPFSNLFLAHCVPFKDFLRDLRILEMKHSIDLFDTPDLRWRQTIDSRLYSSSRELADKLTREDAILFSNLVEDDFDLEKQSARRSELDRRWNNLANDVHCAIKADNTLEATLIAAAQLLLEHAHPNFFSGLALTIGLQRAGYEPTQFTLLANPGNKYSAYQAEWRSRPGLPFLAPHYQVFSSYQSADEVRRDFAQQLKSATDCICGIFDNGIQPLSFGEQTIMRPPSIKKTKSQTRQPLWSDTQSTLGYREQGSWMSIDDDEEESSSKCYTSLISLLLGAFRCKN